jgi:hypothetical protein
MCNDIGTPRPHAYIEELIYLHGDVPAVIIQSIDVPSAAERYSIVVLRANHAEIWFVLLLGVS